MESFKAVTPCVQIGTVGDFILFDTPGFNDSDINRSDKSILIETIKTIRQSIQDPTEGISAFIQCIMPNAAQRITDTAIGAMNLILFTLNCFNLKSDIINHPKLFVIFNDVSKYGNEYDPLTISKLSQSSIQSAKDLEEKRIE